MAAAGTLAAAGCGGGPEQDEEDVREAAERYIESLQEADGEAACEVLTRGAIAQLEAQNEGSCEEVLGERLAADDRAGEQAQDLEVVEVNVGGDVATAKLAGGQGGGPVTQQWRREGDDWKLALSGG